MTDVLDTLKKMLEQRAGDDLIASASPPPRPMLRMMQYGFPEAVLAPGEECTVAVELKGVFRAQKLLMFGQMDAVRGHYKIKRSRLGLLNRDYVVASTRIYRCRRGKKVWFRPGRTTIEYAERRSARSPREGFTRSYLPSSVVYVPVDPLEYIRLKQMYCGKVPQLASGGGGVSGLLFGGNRFGYELPVDQAEVSLSLLLENYGDVQVRVRAAVMGPGQ